MMDIANKQDWLSAWRLPRASAALIDALRAAGPPLLFGLRLWASVCLALYVAFWLELDNPFWAGTSAAIVCQPQLGASLRKGWFRMIGTLVGATTIVVLTALFPQDRIAYLGLLALWCGICAFAATVLHNFASYSAALAGYTAAIIAADTLGATGGASSDVFLLAIWRATEICIGIVCAGIVLAGTDLGGARQRLAALFANLGAEITGQFTRMLALAGPNLPDTQAQRREFTGRVIALDPAVDQVLGESNQVRYHSPRLQGAVHGLFRALDGWRGVAVHLRHLPEDTGRQQSEIILSGMPAVLRAAPRSGSPERWMSDPNRLRHACEKAGRTLIALPASTPSSRLLADETAKMMSGIVRVLDGLALLVDAPGPSLPSLRGFRLSVPDWLPPLVNAARAFVAIGAVELFWLVTAWPSGALAIVFVAIAILLLSPKGDLAYLGALAFALATAGGIVGAAIIKFAVLPGFSTFPAFCGAIGLWLIPVGFAMARSRTPALMAVFAALGVNFMPLLSATNPMIYDTAQFYNSALAIFIGCGTVPLVFRLLPPLSPAMRARRLLALTLRDLRRLATAPVLPRSEDWESRIYARLGVLPEQAEPVQRARLGTALSVGAEIIHLRLRAPRLGVAAELDAALAALARGNGAMARLWLARLDRQLASYPGGEPGVALALRMRARILVVSEALAHHAAYFDDGAP